MQRICILSIVTLMLLIPGCQPSKEVAEKESVVSPQAPDPTAIDLPEASSDTATQPAAEEPGQPEEPAASEPTEPPAEQAATPTKTASTPEPSEPAPVETGAQNLAEPAPRPPKMADIDESEFGPDPELAFASHAFPPTLSDTESHANAWNVNDCLRCHETGVGKAPRVFHKGMADVLLKAKCRSCHVLIPGQSADEVVIKLEEEQLFDEHAFPPMLPNSRSHVNTWNSTDCLRCHEDGLKGAPVTKHASEHMPRLLLKANCRTCHVQVRAIESAVATE